MQVVCQIPGISGVTGCSDRLDHPAIAVATDDLWQPVACGFLGITVEKSGEAAGEWDPCPQLLSTMWHPSNF